MQYVLQVILFLALSLNAHAEGQLPLITPLSQDERPQLLDGKGMLCASIKVNAAEKYYGLLFYGGKIKEVSIREESLHVPDDAKGNPYSLVDVLSAKKIFWRGASGVNSLDRSNLLHLRDGKDHGWCRPYAQRIVTEILLEKIKEEKFGQVSRSIADDLRR